MVQPKTSLPSTRQYGTVKLCKKESELVLFLQTGSNQFWEAYYSYVHRKQSFRNVLPIVTWFNSILKSLHEKKLFLEIPYIIKSSNNWVGS